MSLLSRSGAVAVFLAFAFAYFLSALVRAITATLSPTLAAEFQLQSSDLGLLAGGYFLGFALTQLPLGTWLDRYGPKRVVLWFLATAVLGSLAFSAASSFPALLVSRVLTGVGVSACLMAPLTGYRRWLTPQAQMRANAWMLMSGSLGTIASTLPVQWLMPLAGWRPLFWALAALLLVAMALIAWRAPGWQAQAPTPAPWQGVFGGYGEIWRDAFFRKMAPLGFFAYGGMVAMQTLWAGPWLVKVSGQSPLVAATGLFWLSVSMLVAFWSWGLAGPWLERRGWTADRLVAYGMPLSFGVMAIIVALGARAHALHWTLYCVSSTVVSASLPAVALRLAPALAGRALSAFNLVIFAGVFTVQWGIGLAIDRFELAGLSTVDAFRAAMAGFLACSVLAWCWFLAAPPHNRGS